MMDTTGVTRFEVIDHTSGGKVSTGTGTGRVLVSHGVAVRLALQDNGRTLKVFLTDPEDSAGLVELGLMASPTA